MKASPVQLLQLFYKKIHIELDEQHAPTDALNPLTSIFTFDGVTIGTEVELVEADMEHERGKVYLVALRVLVENIDVEGATDLKFCPYKIDVHAEALVLIPQGAEKLAPPEDLASVNGAGLVWSSIREQVLNASSRMPAGPVTLPTVHFHDLKKTAEEPEVTRSMPKPPTPPRLRPSLKRMR